MSYTFSENYAGGKFKSFLTDREYTYPRTPDGSAKRKALAQLEADDKLIRDAANARAKSEIGRTLKDSEIKAGNWLPDKRTLREKVEQDAVRRTPQPPDPDKSPLTSRVAELEAKLARSYSERDRADILRRLEPLRAQVAAFDAKVAERKAIETKVNSPAVQDALVYGNAWIARLETNPTVPQAWVEAAKERVANLEQSLDPDAFWKANDEFEATRAEHLNEKTLALDAEAAAVRAEAKSLRREAQETPETRASNP